jgi:hypothetical protein
LRSEARNSFGNGAHLRSENIEKSTGGCARGSDSRPYVVMAVRAYKRISSTFRKKPSNPAHAAAEPAQASDAAVAPPPQWLELYERYLPAARAIPDAEVHVCRTDVGVARDNAAFGVASLLGRTPDVVALPDVSTDQIRGLEDLGHALAYAATCAAPIACWTSSVPTPSRRRPDGLRLIVP